jgi:hypothetical protein
VSETGHTNGESAARKAATYFSAAILIGAVVAALAVVVLSGDGDGGPESAPAAFQPEYLQLEERRQAAGVSTMGEPQDADAHFHPRLTVYTNGEKVAMPVNVGIDPGKPGPAMASLHTHETDGTIHVEGMAEASLGQFFEIWGVPFSEEELGPYKAEGSKTVRMWVDGFPSEAFGELPLEDGQQIVVVYGPEDAPPPAEVGG